MPIRTACPCGKVVNAPDNLAGKRVKCPGCGQPLAVPGGAAPAASPKPAARPAPQKPAPARPAPPQPAAGRGPQPGVGFPHAPGGFQQPMQPAGFGGVADLINEEIGRQVKAQIKAEEDELREQEEEKIRAVYLAPKIKAMEMQRKGLKKAESRPISLGTVLSRTWRVFAADWARLLGVTWCAFFVAVVPAMLLTAPLLLLIGVLGALIGKTMPGAGVLVAIIVFFLMFISLVLVPGPLVAWMLAGMSNYVLGRIKGKTMEFGDLFRSGRNLISTWGAMISCMLFGLFPLVPFVITIVSLVIELNTIEDQDIRAMVMNYTALGGLVLMGGLSILSSILILKSSFFSFAIVDKNGTAGDGIGISQAICTGNYWKVRTLNMLAGFLGLLSMLTLGLGLIPLLPFHFVLWGVTYAELSGIPDVGNAASAPAPEGAPAPAGH